MGAGQARRRTRVPAGEAISVDLVTRCIYIAEVVHRSGRLSYVDLESGSRAIVFGDLHGDLDSLERGIGLAGPHDTIIFLGDYADRGPNGVEVIERVNELIETRGDRIVALMGNHEWYTPDGRPTFQPCTLIAEAARKKGSWVDFFGFFAAFVEKLSTAAIFPGLALFVHGGVGPGSVTIDDLENPGDELFTQLMWGDPAEAPGFKTGPRGIGNLFGPDVSQKVLDALGVEALVRSHQPGRARSGPAVDHGGRVITLSSTGMYGGTPHVLVFDDSNKAGDETRNIGRLRASVVGI